MGSISESNIEQFLVFKNVNDKKIKGIHEPIDLIKSNNMKFLLKDPDMIKNTDSCVKMDKSCEIIENIIN